MVGDIRVVPEVSANSLRDCVGQARLRDASPAGLGASREEGAPVPARRSPSPPFHLPPAATTMAFDDEEMLLDADSTQNSSQESLTNAIQAFGALTNGSHTPPTSPTRHSFTLSTASMNTGTEWLEEDLLPTVEQLSPTELSISDGAPLASPAQTDPKERVISHIESVFESMLDVLLKAEGSPTLFLKSRRRVAVLADTPARAIRFPGNTSGEAWKFSMCLAECFVC